MIYAQILYSGLEITLNKDANFSFFLIWSLAFIPLAFMEEIAFRSYPFLQLNKVLGLRITQVVLAVLFALYHVLMGWSIQASFLGPGIWALAYGLTAIASNGISMPTGLHFGVNFVLALIGGQKGIESIWSVDFPTEVSDSVQKANDNFGIGLQLCLLIVCIILTELYIKKKKTTTNNIYYE